MKNTLSICGKNETRLDVWAGMGPIDKVNVSKEIIPSFTAHYKAHLIRMYEVVHEVF